MSNAVQKFGSVAAGKVAYLKQLKYEDWHRQRLLAHVRSNVFGSNEYFMYIPTKKTGHKLLRNRLKGPIRTAFYDDNDDRVVYSMTRSRKVCMQGITNYEQQTLFTYRRHKKKYWKEKTRVQTGKSRGAKAIRTGAFPQATYRHASGNSFNLLKYKLGLNQCNTFKENKPITNDIKLQILKLHNNGMTNREISRELELKIQTVREQMNFMKPRHGVGMPILPEGYQDNNQI